MLGSKIYSDFNEDIGWICSRVENDVKGLPPGLKRLGESLISKRLLIGPTRATWPQLDSQVGRPVAYSVFWFADALGFTERNSIRSFALAMTYSLLVTTLRDDVVDDEKMKGRRSQLLSLARIFQRKYLDIFEKAFKSDSSFWRYLAMALDEQLSYESWTRTFDLDSRQNPLSAGFLEDSSRYLVALALPSLAAVAVASDAEDKIGGITRFGQHLSMGWRVYDDLKDWKIDLVMGEMNRSSFLHYVRQCMGRKKIDEGDVVNLLMDETFVRRVYAPIFLYYGKAKEDIRPFNCDYLTKFMDEQISLNTRTMDGILKGRSEFFGTLEGLLKRQTLNAD
jgi:hypothetical protein